MRRTGNKPLTGSESTSRTGDKYAYFLIVRTEFVPFLRQLKPNSERLSVFRESVIAVYEEKFVRVSGIA